MTLTILDNGTISIQTGNMAGEHHASADEFIQQGAESGAVPEWPSRTSPPGARTDKRAIRAEPQGGQP